MKRSAFLLFVALITAAPLALASSFAGTSAGSAAGGSSASSASSDSTSGNDDKVVLAAREDAAAFVASDGAIRGAQLESALRHLREHDAKARVASDLDLAKAILAL